MTLSVDLRLLQTFVAVAREGNLTHASARLHLTQPAISLQMQRLAGLTGLTLFRRTASGVELTREGSLLAAKAEQVVAAAKDFEQVARRLTGQVHGKLRIGTVIDPEFTRLGAFLNALVGSGSGVETELRQGMSGDVPSALLRDTLDVGYYLGDIGDDAGLDAALFQARELARFRYRVVAPPALAGFLRGSDWAALAALPWIGTPPASVHHRLLARRFAAHGIRQNVVALVDQENSMLAMVRAGVGLSLCRESLALEQQQAHGVAISDRVSVETVLSFLALRARGTDALIKLAFDAIAQAWEAI